MTPLWQAKPETASRVRGRIEAVLDAANAQGHRSGENPATWRGHLAHLLPKRGKLTRAHHAAMDYKEVPAFIAQLCECDGIAAMALEFCILTATRSGEVYGARGLKSILRRRSGPAGRMKAGREHRVPLSSRALSILAELAKGTTGEFVFPSPWGRRPLSHVAMAKVMHRLQIDGATVHGFRSAFRDWAGNETHFPREVAEAALAHVVGDKAEQAYRCSRKTPSAHGSLVSISKCRKNGQCGCASMTMTLLRPFRWVETFTGAYGIRINQRGPGVGMSSPIPSSQVVKAIVAKGGNRITSLYAGGVGEGDLSQLLGEGDMITSAEIKDWFKAWLTPGEDDLRDLSLALNIMRVTVRRKDTADIKRREVKNDIAALLRDLPALIEIEQQTFELRAKSPAAVKHGLMVRKVFDDLLTAARQADKFIGRRAQKTREAAWFGDALWIAMRLRMLGEKGDLAVGLTKAECPAVQFIDTALKRACPKDKAADSSIARAMARHKELVEPWTAPDGV